MSIVCQCPRSPPLEDDDLLSEILLRLPTLPASLPRASAVCKRWCCLISDPGFVRRFRRHHSRNPPPILGVFGQDVDGIAVQPTMEPPNHVPPGRFSMPSNARSRLKLLGCHHGPWPHANVRQGAETDPGVGSDHQGPALPCCSPGVREDPHRGHREIEMSIFRHCPPSPAAAPPLEVDDLLSEILLRLPPLPSSLPRASAVCKRWRCLVSDRGFVRRFRRHHSRNPPPLLGFIGQSIDGIAFQPTMDPPNRVPPGRFSMPPDARSRLKLLECRHGLMLMFDKELDHVLVWDPVAGEQHNVAVARDSWPYPRSFGRCFALFERLATSEWPNVLAGGSLYWGLTGIGCVSVIVQLDLKRQSLAMTHLPVEFAPFSPCHFELMPAEGGGLGLLFMSGLTAQLWKMNTDCDGAASWVLERTIEMDKLLSLNSKEGRRSLFVAGFAESNNAVFLGTSIGLFMVQLESLKFKKVSKPNMLSCCHPFESIYAAGNSIPLHCG
ncbi:unnamed protein product [Alopecurus aequalis]